MIYETFFAEFRNISNPERMLVKTHRKQTIKLVKITETRSKKNFAFVLDGEWEKYYTEKEQNIPKM